MMLFLAKIYNLVVDGTNGAEQPRHTFPSHPQANIIDATKNGEHY